MLNFKSFSLLIAGTASRPAPPGGNCALVAFSAKTQSSAHFKINSFSELIYKKSKLNMKLLTFFNGTKIFISSKSVLMSLSAASATAPTLPTNFVL